MKSKATLFFKGKAIARGEIEYVEIAAPGAQETEDALAARQFAELLRGDGADVEDLGSGILRVRLPAQKR